MEDFLSTKESDLFEACRLLEPKLALYNFRSIRCTLAKWKYELEYDLHRVLF